MPRYNPPPNWPAPPAGWRPDPAWKPDPSWPPMPPGWPLWLPDDAGTTDGPRAPKWRRAAYLAFVAVAAVVVVVFVGERFGESGDRGTADSAQRFFPQGDSSSADGPYLALLQEWGIPYNNPYEAVAIGRKSCELLLDELPGAAANGERQSQTDVVSALYSVEDRVGGQLPEYSELQIHLIVSAAMNKLCPINTY